MCRLLEPVATALAAQRISDAQVVALREILVGMKNAQDPEDLLKRDMDFHAHIAGAFGNSRLCSILEAVSTRSVRARVWPVSTVGLHR